ncbi:MAG: oligosaccharide flippase family protein, partial [Candidatus Binatia bacterium]
MTIGESESVHLRPDLREIGRRAAAGGLTLGARQLAGSIVAIAAGITLARALPPAVFGVYAVVTFVTRFFVHFSDVGLGAALIRKSRVDAEEFSTAFVMQQVLVLLAVVVLWFTAETWASAYDISGASTMIRVLALSFWVASLGTIPSLRLEREMRFPSLAFADLTSTIAYHVATVVLALAGYGVWSFIVGALLRSLTSALVLNLVSPWRPSLRFRSDLARDLLSFGLPFQLNKIVTLVKDN